MSTKDVYNTAFLALVLGTIYLACDRNIAGAGTSIMACVMLLGYFTGDNPKD